MGNKSSVATLRVVFDQTDVVSGSIVTGKAYLSVNQDEVSCGSIGTRVLGQERTKVRYTVTVGSGKNRRTEHRTAYEQRNFMDQRFCLQSVPSGKIRRGQYEYPFQFAIPGGAPASMGLGGRGGSNQCSIGYYMEVWLDRPGFLRWDIKNRVFVNVTNPPPAGRNVPLYIEPTTVPLHSCCCIRRGDIMMGGSAESNILSAGGQSSVKYAVQNSSTVPVKAIEVTISERVTFSARGHHSAHTVSLYHTRLTPAEAGLDLALRPSQKGQPHPELMELRNMLESDAFKLNFTIPATARNSYSGSIIRVEHTFTIKAVTTFGTANPIICRNIQMFSKSRPEELEPFDEASASQKHPDAPQALPSGWAPAVAQRVELPPMALCFPVEHVEDNDNVPVAYASSTSFPAVEVYRSFDQFLAALKLNYDPCGKLERYIRNGNSVETLSAEQFYAMFAAINDPFDQQRFAETLATSLTSITCAKVARSAAAAKDMCKREVVEKLLTVKLADKEGVELVKAQLTPFQFMTVEKYFQ